MGDDSIKLHNYQDDLDNDPNAVDEVTHQQTDDLKDTAGIPSHELAHELKKLKIDELGRGDDDMREQLEDVDEEQGRRNS